MPWTVDDPPNPAQNWTDKEKEKCVEAANAVLRDGGTEEEAIFACIHNAGKGRGDDMDRELDYKTLPGFETKSFPTFVKSFDEDQGIVDHYIAVMGNIDEGLDRIMWGAFRKTIVERGGRIRVLDNHKMDSVTRIVGKPVALREVPRAELPQELLSKFPEATGGLLATTQYAMDTQRGREVFNLVKGGFAPENSIGYDAIKPRHVKELINGEEKTVRELPEIRLWEYGNVIFGMNPAAIVVSAKSKDSADAETDTSTEDPPEDEIHSVTLDIKMDEVLEALVKQMLIERDIKEASLDEQARRVRDAFYAAIRPSLSPPLATEEAADAWVREVFDTLLIVESGAALFAYPYTNDNDGNVAFGEPYQVEINYVRVDKSGLSSPQIKRGADKLADTEPATEPKAEPDTPEAGPISSPTSDAPAPLTFDVDRIKSVIDIELEEIDLLLLMDS